MEHPFYEEERVFSRHEAWEYLLLNANHSDNKVMIDGKMVTVERGSFISSIRKFQERWKWSNTKAIQFLDMLESEGMIIRKSDTKKTVITIVKYDFYQGEGEEKTTQERHENDTETMQKRTNKNVKNDKNDNKTYKADFSDYTQDSELIDTLESFFEFRKQIKKPMTEKAVKLLLNKLNELASTDMEKVAILNQSILEGWQGVFPLKTNSGRPKRPDNELEARRMEIARNKWINGGGNPDEFVYTPTGA
jgi:hypothetical protein